MVWSVAEKTLRTAGLLLCRLDGLLSANRNRRRVVLPPASRDACRADHPEDGPPRNAEAVRKLLHRHPLESQLHNLAVSRFVQQRAQTARLLVPAARQR